MTQDPGTTASAGSTGHSSTSGSFQLLPIDKVFSIQIGSEVFRISGNALNSDSPSYFTHYFTANSGDQLKPLYIDRDPVIFKDIVRHLQGYLLTPRNEEHFVYLYSDAIYYRLPKLRQRLFRDFYVRIGETSFQIPKELFNDVKQKGDSKNFFSMGFGSAMGSPFPDDKMFPQLNMDNFDLEKQLRPPYLIPPKLSRSSENFQQILQYMQGYEIEVRNDIHRRNLIKDSRFYNLRHLTESLIPAKTYHNPFRGNAAEILLSVTDFRPSNSRIGWIENQPFGWMEYKRPHDIDKEARDLLVQIEDDGIIVGGGKILLINRQALKHVKLLKETVEGRKTETHPGALLGGREEVAMRIDIPVECPCVFDEEDQRSAIVGQSNTSAITTTSTSENGQESALKKRKLSEIELPPGEIAVEMPSSSGTVKAWILKRSIWRVKVRGQRPPATEDGTNAQGSTTSTGGGRRTMILVGVNLEGWRSEKQFSKELGWL